MRCQTLLIFALLVLNRPIYADSGAKPLDAASIEALHKTQDLMRSREGRAELTQADPKAQAAISHLDGVLGQNAEKGYELSNQILQKIVEMSQGDPAKMQEIMNQLLSDPKRFETMFPDKMEQIRGMASDIEKKKPASVSVPAH